MNTYTVSFYGLFDNIRDVGTTSIQRLDSDSVLTFINLALHNVLDNVAILPSTFHSLQWFKTNTIWEAECEGKKIIVLLFPQGE